MRRMWIAGRLVAAALVLAALAAQLVNSLTVGTEPASAVVANFFSYFTVQSNLLSVVVLAASAVTLLRTGRDGPRLAVVRVMAATYMGTTGVVFNLLLRGIDTTPGLIVPWSNEVLHVVGPILVVADWLLAPGRRRLEWRALLAVVAYPIVWAVYTLVRGPIVGWYPYPFLDPSLAPTGYASVAFYVVLIAAIIGGIGALLVLENRRRVAAQ